MSAESKSAQTSVAPQADVLFVHIPKTGGMSLYNSMARWFGAEASLRYPRSTDEFKQKFLQLSDEELHRIRLICGHFDLPFWLQRKLGDRFVISLVREPVERVLSTYRYAKSWTQHPRHGLVGEMSVAEYVDSQVSDPTRHNGQCRRLCGAGDFHAAREMALRHIDVLGALELIGMLSRAIGDRLGVPLDIRSDNLSPDPRPKREDLDASLLAKLQSCNTEDYKLWAWVIESNLVRGHR